ncbi:pyrroline-5-carboxylate reductase, partial [Lacrimispora saccharolytica]|nr:pyrroline-5-carboxylate reductase [Lacrimispora saccharolytica]
MAVKPQYYEEVISEIKDDIQKNQVIVTIAPGKTLTWLSERLGSEVKIIRIMPSFTMAGVFGMVRMIL